MTQATLIIGSGPGLSASIARRFAQSGSQIVLASRSIEDLAGIAAETDAICVACDATSENEVASLFAHLDSEGLALETMVYNAGAYVRGALTELCPADVQRVISVNAFGAFLAAREGAVRMKQAGRGAMLFTGASAGVKGYANSSAFAMGKFALRGLCQSLARELAPQNIHIAHFIIDGIIYAPERGSPYDDRSKCLDPDRIAEAYFQVATQHKSAWTWEMELRPWTESF